MDIPLSNQSVLLRGINDTPQAQLDLIHKLVINRVRPYYLYQCDLVQGAGHFRTPISVGIEIMEALREHTSGYAVPTYVVDAPGDGGKIPVGPNYMISQAPGKVTLRNYEGYIVSYSEPDEPYHCQDSHQSLGVADLNAGNQMAIKPERFGERHRRKHVGETVEADGP